ncbi:hypothetical protein D3C87_397890 [compost metagenome]
MKIISASLLLFIIYCCTPKKVLNQNKLGFEYIETKEEFEFELTEFYKNNAYCFTEGIPYALLIGKTKSTNLPSTISVLSQCDNNDYKIGSKFIIKPIENPEKRTTLHPIYFVKRTLVDNVKCSKVIGSENKAVWGIPKEIK